MKLLSKSCGGSMSSCPAVYDMEDSSGRLLIIGSGAYHDGEAAGVKINPGETAIWIDRAVVEDALADLIDVYRRDGVSKDAIVSAMELKKMSLEENSED